MGCGARRGRRWLCGRRGRGRFSPASAAAAAEAGEKRPRPRRPHSQRRPRRAPQPKEGNAPQIHIYPLGGLGEVGKNMTVYECCGDMIIVDCGLVFPDSDMFGVDLVICLLYTSPSPRDCS